MLAKYSLVVDEFGLVNGSNSVSLTPRADRVNVAAGCQTAGALRSVNNPAAQNLPAQVELYVGALLPSQYYGVRLL